jgi:hypothetical protein
LENPLIKFLVQKTEGYDREAHKTQSLLSPRQLLAPADEVIE